MYNLTKALKDDGVPIHYVGAQTHIDLRFADFEGFTDSVKEYSQVVYYIDMISGWPTPGIVNNVQRDHSGRTKPPVDFKTKVPLWPDQARLGQAKAELLI